MNKETEEKFVQTVKPMLKKIRDNALSEGAKAMCGVILSKAKDKTKTDNEKIQDIIKFCETSLGVAKKFGEKNNEKS